MSLISGVKEKVIAAKEVGIAEDLLPIGNERDYDGMQSYLKECLEAHFVSCYQDVANILFIER